MIAFKETRSGKWKATVDDHLMATVIRNTTGFLVHDADGQFIGKAGTLSGARGIIDSEYLEVA